jgi:uncharacterized metal-binding protein
MSLYHNITSDNTCQGYKQLTADHACGNTMESAIKRAGHLEEMVVWSRSNQLVHAGRSSTISLRVDGSPLECIYETTVVLMMVVVVTAVVQ